MVNRALLLLAAALAAGRLPADATNPVIWADVPDPSIIRVGSDYYMSSTTMHLSPGVPVMHSRDLVNWELADYACSTLADTDSLALRAGKSAYGNGTWASSLRRHAGQFIVSTFSHDTGRTHVYRTPSLGAGPWRADSFEPACHDQSLFFDDDGRAYLVFGGGRLEIMELKPDASAPLPGGLRRTLIENATAPATTDRQCLQAEGSQLFKINGRYYLLNICWPRGRCRTVLCHRAPSLAGPWEGRVLLQDKGVAQGSLVDTPDGRWYAFLFRDAGAVGRVPWLVPVTWKDGWPELGTDGKAPELLPGLPASRGPVPGIVASDEFDRKPGERALPLAWQWNHNPDPRGWTLAERPGWLRLKAFAAVPGLEAAPDQLGQRTFGPTCAAETLLDASALREGDFAGLALFQKNYGFIGVTVTNGLRRLVAVRAIDGRPVETASVSLPAVCVRLRARCEYRAGADRGGFAYSLDGKEWKDLGDPLRMVYTLPHFMGYRFGLFCFATRAPGGRADFDCFRVTP